MTSKKNPHFDKNIKNIGTPQKQKDFNSKLPMPLVSLPPQSPEEQLYDNINRLSQTVAQQINFSVIFGYLKLFLKKRKIDVIQSASVLALVFVGGNIFQLFLASPSAVINFSLKIVYFAVTLMVGIKILRSTIFTQSEKKECPFFYGFAPFAGLHVILIILGLISVLIVEYGYVYLNLYNIDYEYSYFLSCIVSMSITTSLLLTRFSVVIPAMIYRSDDDVLQDMSQRIKPFLKPLFFTVFFTKFLCLNMIVFSDALPDYLGNPPYIQYMIIIPKMIGFVFYHLFTYILLGVSFKLYCKMKVKA